MKLLSVLGNNNAISGLATFYINPDNIIMISDRFDEDGPIQCQCIVHLKDVGYRVVHESKESLVARIGEFS